MGLAALSRVAINARAPVDAQQAAVTVSFHGAAIATTTGDNLVVEIVLDNRADDDRRVDTVRADPTDG
jgi:hypothetical protein